MPAPLSRRFPWLPVFALVLVAAFAALQPAPDSAQAANGLTPLVTETGMISLSIDGLGTNNVAGGTISANKPVGATVRSAWLAAAATVNSNRALASGDVKIDGASVTFTAFKTQIQTPPNTSTNAWGDVTALVKPKLDGAPAGIVNFTITEVTTATLDGEVLAVIFNDPNQTTSNTVVLFFGALSTTGDTFAINLASPVNKADPKLLLDLSLGISFSCQVAGPCALPYQFSTVDVNGQRMTSNAGGADDGSAANGALLTAGGFEDSNANPADPNSNSSPDDELYSLIPFVNNGDKMISVATMNPSNDDNIFFAGLFLRSVTASVGESILLAPATATNPLGASHTLTATVTDVSGAPSNGKVVTFTVLTGPNAGTTLTATTNVLGIASASYIGNTAGTDTIQASFVNSALATQTSNIVSKIWQAVVLPGPAAPSAATPTLTPVPPPPPPPPVIPRVVPQVFQNPGLQGIILSGNHATPTPVVRAVAVAPITVDPGAQVIVRPPNTGDAGLATSSQGRSPDGALVLGGIVLLMLGMAGTLRLRHR